MGKKTITSVVVIVLFLGIVAGYRNINHMFPARVVKSVEKGEKIKFLDGIEIAVKDTKWMSEEEKKAAYEKSAVDTNTFDYDTEVIEVTVELSNNTTEKQEVSITDLNLEGTGVSNGISRELVMGNQEYYGSLKLELDSGESKEITYPYEVSSAWFHKKDWIRVKDRKFWLTFSSYPEKSVLYL